MSDTPRTDAIAHRGYGPDVYIAKTTDLCRQLERELAEALSDLEFRRGLYALQSERVGRLERQLEQLKATLSDPGEVELAMIRGHIAIPDRVEFDGIREPALCVCGFCDGTSCNHGT